MFDPQKPHLCGSRNTLIKNTSFAVFSLVQQSLSTGLCSLVLKVLLSEVAMLFPCFSR